MSRTRTFARLLVRAALRPRLALRLAGAAWRFRRRRWYLRPPFLPLPPASYLAWRLETAYGSDDTDIPLGPVDSYLDWSAAQSRAARSRARVNSEAGVIKPRTLLVIGLLLAAVLAIPPVREVAGPVLAPGKRLVDNTIGRLWRNARDQVFRWSVRNEARTLARELQSREMSGQPLPRPQDFSSYMQRRTISGTGGLDKWGSPYYMLLYGDSITVVSPGPDQRPGSEDDVRESVGRDR